MTARDVRRGGSVGRAAALSGVLIAAGTGLGFVRDLVMAHRFGASGSTDAFLVAWTIPETVSPLLIEDAMALLMVPVVTRLLARGGGLRAFTGTTLPRMAAALTVVTLALGFAAPIVVGALAPGLTQPGPAVQCVRLTALTVVTFGLAGFMSATLRAHHRFGPPAAIYLAYNVGILALIAGFAGLVGIMSAAIGVACGSVLMVAVQLPAFVRCLREDAAPQVDRAELRLGLAAVAPVVVYTVTRQAQVFVERFIGSGLTAGSISHLNYAQKVAQVPMVLSLLIVTVTFPRLARASADGDTGGVARRIQQDLVVASGLVLCAAAFLIAFAPAVIAVLFQHGAFTAADTRDTAATLRVYALGLWGQSAVGLAARAFFAQKRPPWRPAGVLAGGLAVTAAVCAGLAAAAGTVALAAADAAGITLAAVLLLAGLRARVAPIALRRVAADLARLALFASLAGAAALLATGPLGRSGDAASAIVRLAAGGLATAAAFAALIAVAGRDLIAPWGTPWPSWRPGALARRGRTSSGGTSDPADRTGAAHDAGDGADAQARAASAGGRAAAAGADVPLDRSLR
ncbi:lipid II flippase MurJ [Actinomadura opuntiae]|uniref:lipid II flippase MurJ n=1 Tax=Actinomadura sp. OS1-43 TaxID=604315 RepID=UPI00255B0990|nr:lipid II flippase MurJ [Actinomadura sp. OS1-43]MDL4818456.1 lipid II flippase MurJ [Actinomadura sp. OS1-43]